MPTCDMLAENNIPVVITEPFAKTAHLSISF